MVHRSVTYKSDGGAGGKFALRSFGGILELDAEKIEAIDDRDMLPALTLPQREDDLRGSLLLLPSTRLLFNGHRNFPIPISSATSAAVGIAVAVVGGEARDHERLARFLGQTQRLEPRRAFLREDVGEQFRRAKS